MAGWTACNEPLVMKLFGIKSQSAWNELKRHPHPRVEAAFLVEMLDIRLRIADEIEGRLS